MILGHERQINYLEKVFKNGRMSHAYLFYGPESVGKFTVAKALAKFFHCENYRGRTSIDRACNECAQCRLIDQNVHPHVFILDPEHTLVSKKEKRKDIPIEDIRELKRIFSLAPVGDKWRIAILNHAERMSEEAANAFLKILEEPGGRTCFILVTTNAGLLAPTVVSRATALRFSTVPEKTLSEFLNSRLKEKDDREELLGYAAGRPGVMIKLLEEKDSLLRERNFLKDIERAIRGGLPEVLLFSDRIAYEDELCRKAAAYVLGKMRQSVLQEPSSVKTAPLMRKLKNVLLLSYLREVTNVNSRLALDLILGEVLGNSPSPQYYNIRVT